jgi:hypothetical protein
LGFFLEIFLPFSSFFLFFFFFFALHRSKNSVLFVGDIFHFSLEFDWKVGRVVGERKWRGVNDNRTWLLAGNFCSGNNKKVEFGGIRRLRQWFPFWVKCAFCQWGLGFGLAQVGLEMREPDFQA